MAENDEKMQPHTPSHSMMMMRMKKPGRFFCCESNTQTQMKRKKGQSVLNVKITIRLIAIVAALAAAR